MVLIAIKEKPQHLAANGSRFLNRLGSREFSLNNYNNERRREEENRSHSDTSWSAPYVRFESNSRALCEFDDGIQP